MKEKPSLPPLPPLSVKALRELQEIEDEVADAVKDCDDFAPSISRIFHSPRRIERVLRTCLVAALDVQIDYYSSLPDYRATWIVQIIGSTVGSLLGLFPPLASGERYRGVLLHTAAEHIKTRALNLRKPSLESSSQNETPRISEQLELLRKECRMTVEQLAEDIGIDVRSVRRHLRGQSVPYDRHLWAYEKIYSKLLQRKVVIRKMS